MTTTTLMIQIMVLQLVLNVVINVMGVQAVQTIVAYVVIVQDLIQMHRIVNVMMVIMNL